MHSKLQIPSISKRAKEVKAEKPERVRTHNRCRRHHQRRRRPTDFIHMKVITTRIKRGSYTHAQNPIKLHVYGCCACAEEDYHESAKVSYIMHITDLILYSLVKLIFFKMSIADDSVIVRKMISYKKNLKCRWMHEYSPSMHVNSTITETTKS